MALTIARQEANSELVPVLSGTSAAKKPRKGISHAKKMLAPGEILNLDGRQSIEAHWEWFASKLEQAGFESCGFLISRSDIESPLGHPESRLYGEVVSEDYLSFVQQNPEMQSQARPYKMIRKTRAPVTYLSDADLGHSTPSERKLAQEINQNFNIKGWALFPIHAPEKNRMYTLGWWNLEDQQDARKLWEAESDTFTLAATYFAESISALVNQTMPEDVPSLSQREMECLLWAGAGKTTAEIAAVLNVADGTVEEYFKRAAKKLGATTRTQACVKAVLSGLIQP